MALTEAVAAAVTVADDYPAEAGMLDWCWPNVDVVADIRDDDNDADVNAKWMSQAPLDPFPDQRQKNRV